jgi:hypothetical protein
MSTPTFERTAPVFEGRKIVIAIDSDNPLSTQLEMISGDGWNSIDWTDSLRTGEITHKKSGLVVKVQKNQPDDYQPLFDLLHQEHSITPLESEMSEIVDCVKKMLL